jgi:hypothetical protein
MIAPMIDDDKYVSRDEHLATTTALIALLAQLQMGLAAVSTILRECGILTPELWAHHCDKEMSSEHGKRVIEAIEKLRGGGSLRDILKDFEGPIQ